MINTIDEFIGRRLRAKRRSLKMTQQAVAEIIGVTFQQICKYETGGSRISAETLFRISKGLDVPVGYFFEGIEA